MTAIGHDRLRQRFQRRRGLLVILLGGILIWWVWHERSLSVLAAAILLFVAPACWIDANDPTKHSTKAGYTFSVLLILLAATISLTGFSLQVAARASSIAALILLGIGLFSRKWAKGLKNLRLRRLLQTMPNADNSKIADALLDERGTLVALESLLEGEIRLVAVTLGCVSIVLWVARAILTRS
jgi:hypothetical protein